MRSNVESVHSQCTLQLRCCALLLTLHLSFATTYLTTAPVFACSSVADEKEQQRLEVMRRKREALQSDLIARRGNFRLCLSAPVRGSFGWPWPTWSELPSLLSPLPLATYTTEKTRWALRETLRAPHSGFCCFLHFQARRVSEEDQMKKV